MSPQPLWQQVWLGKCCDFGVGIIWQGKRNTTGAAESHYLQVNPDLTAADFEFCLHVESRLELLKKICSFLVHKSLKAAFL